MFCCLPVPLGTERVTVDREIAWKRRPHPPTRCHGCASSWRASMGTPCRRRRSIELPRTPSTSSRTPLSASSFRCSHGVGRRRTYVDRATEDRCPTNHFNRVMRPPWRGPRAHPRSSAVHPPSSAVGSRSPPRRSSGLPPPRAIGRARSLDGRRAAASESDASGCISLAILSDEAGSTFPQESGQTSWRVRLPSRWFPAVATKDLPLALPLCRSGHWRPAGTGGPPAPRPSLTPGCRFRHNSNSRRFERADRFTWKSGSGHAFRASAVVPLPPLRRRLWNLAFIGLAPR